MHDGRKTQSPPRKQFRPTINYSGREFNGNWFILNSQTHKHLYIYLLEVLNLNPFFRQVSIMNQNIAHAVFFKYLAPEFFIIFAPQNQK